ncbi:MAG: PQQ-binding-like beta-propeller repeat protein [Acidobacteriota bacterium]
MRFSCAPATAVLVLTLLGSAFGTPAAFAEDWPAFLGPTADGRSGEEISLDWGEKGPEVLWFGAVGEGYSAPSVVADVVYVFDRVKDEARLYALSAEDGELLWSESYPSTYEDLYRYSGGPRAVPVVDDGRVFAFGVDGRLRAHRSRNGEVLWDVDTNGRFGVVQNFFGAGSTPVVEGDLLIVMVGGSPEGSPSISAGKVRGNGSGIVAFDKRSGEVRYRLSDELSSYATVRVATVDDRRWAFAFTRGGLLAFEPATGAEDFFFPWRAKKLESVNAATPVVVGDKVFITESYGPGGALLQVGQGAGEAGHRVVWKDARRGKSLESHWATPVYRDGFLYASSGQSTGEATLRAVRLDTGEVTWSEPGLGRSTLLLAGEHLVVLTEHGRLLLVEANPEKYVKLADIDYGTRRSSRDADAKVAAGAPSKAPALRFPVWNAPVLSNGRLFLRGKDQLLVLNVAPAEPAPQDASP